MKFRNINFSYPRIKEIKGKVNYFRVLICRISIIDLENMRTIRILVVIPIKFVKLIHHKWLLKKKMNKIRMNTKKVNSLFNFHAKIVKKFNKL